MGDSITKGPGQLGKIIKILAEGSLLIARGKQRW